MLPDWAHPSGVPAVRLSYTRAPFNRAALADALAHPALSPRRAAALTEAVSPTEYGRGVVVGVTSAIAGEGKTTLALALAACAARDTFRNVCLLDLGLGDDEVARRLGADAAWGVNGVLEGASPAATPPLPALEMDFQGADRLTLIPGGKAPANATRAARSPALPHVIAAAREAFDIVVVDLPAVSTGQAHPIAEHLDRLLVVVRAGVTPKEVVADAVQRVGSERVTGVVLNRVKPAAPGWLRRLLDVRL